MKIIFIFLRNCARKGKKKFLILDIALVSELLLETYDAYNAIADVRALHKLYVAIFKLKLIFCWNY